MPFTHRASLLINDKVRNLLKYIYDHKDYTLHYSYVAFNSVSAIIEESIGHRKLSAIMATGSALSNAANTTELTARMQDNGYTHNSFMSALLAKPRIKTLVYVNDSTKSLIVVTSASSFTIEQYSIISLLYLTQFGSEDVTDTDMLPSELNELIRLASEALTQLKPIPYHPWYDRIANFLNEQQQAKQQKLIVDSLLSLFDRDNTTPAIEHLEQVIADLYRRINIKYDQLEILRLLQFKKQHGLDGASDQLKEIFAHYVKEGSIYYASVDGSSPNKINLGVKGYLSFSEDTESLIQAIERGAYTIPDKDFAAQLVRDVSDYKLLIPMIGNYQVTTSSDTEISILGITDSYYPPYNMLVNKHITKYNCFDGYKAHMRMAFADGNLDLFFSTLIQSAGSIAPYDGTVFSDMKRDILDPDFNIPVRYKQDDGTWIDTTIGGYYEIFKAEQARVRETNTNDDQTSGAITNADSDSLPF